MDIFLDISTIAYPEKEIQDKVNELRQIFVEKFNSREALAWKPHISIAERVLIPKSRLKNITKKIRLVCNKTSPILVKASLLEFVKKDNSPFKYPYLVWISLKTDRRLNILNHKINNEIYKGLKRPSMKSKKYKPHITLAYRDLSLENFNRSKKYFENYKYDFNFNFKLEAVTLIHHKEKNSVDDYMSFKLKGE